MKNLYVYFAIFFVFSCSQEVSHDSLVTRNGIAYEVNSQNPYNGTAVKFFDNGQLEEKISYKNGIINGQYESYYKNGQLRIKAEAANGDFIGEYNAYTFSGKEMLIGSDKIISDHLTLDKIEFKKTSCDTIFTDEVIGWDNKEMEEFFLDKNMSTTVTDIAGYYYQDDRTFDEFIVRVNFVANRHLFTSSQWEFIFKSYDDFTYKQRERCNPNEDAITRNNNFVANRDQMFKKAIAPKLNATKAFNLEKIESNRDDALLYFIDQNWGYSLDDIDECEYKEFPMCLKKFLIFE